MRSLFAVSLLATAVFGVLFINPPNGNGAGYDYSDIVYVEGSTVIIQWSDVPKGFTTTLAMYQAIDTGTSLLEPKPEYLIQNGSYDVISYTWHVGTTRNLTVGNRFLFSLQFNDSTLEPAASQVVNITDKRVIPMASNFRTLTTTSTSSTQSSSLASKSTVTSDSGTSNTTSVAGSISTSSSAAVPTTRPTSSELGISARVGLGIGIPAAILLGAGLGWFISRRWKKQGIMSTPTNSSMQSNQALEKMSPLHSSGESNAVHEMEEGQPPELGEGQQHELEEGQRHELQRHELL